MKTLLLIPAGILVLCLSCFLKRLISRRLRISDADAQPGTGRANAGIADPLQVHRPADPELDASGKQDAEDKIHELFFPFSNYLDELLGVNDIAVIIADHHERQSVLLKRNGAHLDVMKLDYDHAIVRMMCDLGNGEKQDGESADQTGNAAGGNRGALREDRNPGGTAWGQPGAGPDDCDGDAARELRLINDLYRIAVNKYNQNMHLRKLSEVDDLTGLSNHRHFQEQLDQEIKIALRMDRPLSIIFIDIDHFKIVNDTHGHQTGDLVLSELAGVARSKLRGTDQIARYGGEEFAVILPGTSRRPACEVAERLREAVEQHEFVSTGNQPLRITISMGVSDISECGDRHSLIQAADQALYRAKQTGRNKVMV